jgi:hypothetical protein
MHEQEAGVCDIEARLTELLGPAFLKPDLRHFGRRPTRDVKQVFVNVYAKDVPLRSNSAR